MDLLAVQGTLKGLLQYHHSKASFLWHSAFFMVQLSHMDMNIGKTIALTIWPFVGKVMSLLFNTLSRFVIAFLPRKIPIIQLFYVVVLHDCPLLLHLLCRGIDLSLNASLLISR